MPASAVGTIVAEILGEARRRGGTVYNKVKNALAFHVNTYAQFLEDVAKGVKKGEMTVTEAAEAVKTAALLLSTSVWSQVKDIKDLEYVKGEIVKTYAKYTKEMIPQKQLDESRSRLRYGFSMAMNSNDAIAGALAQFVSFNRSPETIDKLFALYDSIKPEDIRAAAAKYFKDNNQTIVTLTTKTGGEK